VASPPEPVEMLAMLPLAHRWPFRCARCGHYGEVNAALADVTSKMLRCAACSHRQPFEPASVVRSSRQANGWRARPRRAHHKRLCIDRYQSDRWLG
jgi:hypothetical protein